MFPRSHGRPDRRSSNNCLWHPDRALVRSCCSDGLGLVHLKEARVPLCADLIQRNRKMAGRLEGRVAVVIGAARGIGAAIAVRFVTEGARVIIGDTEVGAARATVERLGGDAVARFVETDISQAADAER